MPDWTIADATPVDASATADFAERVWADYHRDQGRDQTDDWHSRPIELIARDEAGSIIGLTSGDMSAGSGI